MEQKELKVLCPFCNGVQSSEVVAALDSISDGCDTCGYGMTAEITVEVYCEHCKRLIYSKETHTGDY